MELNTLYISKIFDPKVRRFVQQWLITQRIDSLLAGAVSGSQGSMRRTFDLNMGTRNKHGEKS